MRWLRALLPSSAPPVPPPPLPRLDPPVCVVGDLHGRLDLLEEMLTEIATRNPDARARIVFVGDMMDRGPDSAAVLARLFELQQSAPARIHCLMGNHERMLLDFLQDPTSHGARWITHGGSDTLISFGLSPFRSRQTAAMLTELAEGLKAALGPDRLHWLSTLPLIWQEGALAVTHAGADPALPLEAQSDKRLLWGPRTRETGARGDDLWVAQGHVITPTAHAESQRIMVDTGAWRSGMLSAAWIGANGLSFINISGGN